jgi:hypothetical protein
LKRRKHSLAFPNFRAASAALFCPGTKPQIAGYVGAYRVLNSCYLMALDDDLAPARALANTIILAALEQDPERASRAMARALETLEGRYSRDELEAALEELLNELGLPLPPPHSS